ncbi:hypothetical protein QRX60_34080 [Amycolatopsis mongoliensis]|uniref:Alpha/beta hydrolase n=1 Tax=Amycolatopsis mongoliensis TaxID=715475 RepID=A0A9Y2NC06_9PSEU|nr:hypothetical protein [Amycolatopsis sp. 4-36]WIX99056.1 hypothetical protein QRX60_34080 [Amycolatopsis sp. 4-36]
MPARELDVETRYGPTRVRASGEAGPPVVLLPGGVGTSLSWYPHVAELAGVSTGGRHALALATRAPSRVAAVVAIEPSGFAVIGSAFLWWSLREIVRWFDPRPGAAVRRTLRPLLFGALKRTARGGCPGPAAARRAQRDPPRA